MAQLYYRYSTMNAGKSIELIKVAYNYEERGKHIMTLSPSVDDRYGVGKITSRIGISRDAIVINGDTDLVALYKEHEAQQHIDCILMDECQFLKKHQVIQLAKIVDEYGCPVMCYGLKNDFQNELFEGSHYLLVYADKIEEIKTICHCGRKATMVARVDEAGNIIREGAQLVIGGNDMYVSLCRKHYMAGDLGPDFAK
ncbi:MAG: thymidine kinase [Clostridia bacterium]|nr:thymidine kinase [Clostridia bacterium]